MVGNSELLDAADARLARLVMAAGEIVDLYVIETSRSLDRQRAYVSRGVSKTLRSGHIVLPKAKAVDLGPMDSDRAMRTDHPRYEFALGRVIGVIEALTTLPEFKDVKVRMGWDFNGNKKFDDAFFDGAHIEIAGYKLEPDTRWPFATSSNVSS